MIGDVTQSGPNRNYDTLGFTYDPATGKGYDIEGALVFDNGQYLPGAGYQPTGPAVPLAIDPSTGRPAPITSGGLSDKTLFIIVGVAALLLIGMKK